VALNALCISGIVRHQTRAAASASGVRGVSWHRRALLRSRLPPLRILSRRCKRGSSNDISGIAASVAVFHRNAHVRNHHNA